MVSIKNTKNLYELVAELVLATNDPSETAIEVFQKLREFSQTKRVQANRFFGYISAKSEKPITIASTDALPSAIVEYLRQFLIVATPNGFIIADRRHAAGDVKEVGNGLFATDAVILPSTQPTS